MEREREQGRKEGKRREEVNIRSNWFRGSFLYEDGTWLVHAAPGPSSGAQGPRKTAAK